MNNYHCAECGFSEADVNGENCGYCDRCPSDPMPVQCPCSGNDFTCGDCYGTGIIISEVQE